mgnify:CR=1 FL=1
MNFNWENLFREYLHSFEVNNISTLIIQVDFENVFYISSIKCKMKTSFERRLVSFQFFQQKF